MVETAIQPDQVVRFHYIAKSKNKSGIEPVFITRGSLLVLKLSRRKIWRCHLKRVANSYSVGNRSAQSVAVRSRALPIGAGAGTRASSRARSKSRIPQIPNYVWLAMVVLAFTALSFSTYRRAQDAEQEAVQSHAVVSSRVENARAANRQIKTQTEQIKTNPRAAQAAAQQHLRVLRRNEVVVASP